jgi:hypothetical protein
MPHTSNEAADFATRDKTDVPYGADEQKAQQEFKLVKAEAAVKKAAKKAANSAAETAVKKAAKKAANSAAKGAKKALEAAVKKAEKAAAPQEEAKSKNTVLRRANETKGAKTFTCRACTSPYKDGSGSGSGTKHSSGFCSA